MKDKLDAILKAFGDYIRGQDFFDIVYSEKVGYVRILARNLDEEGPELMDTPEKLLDSLFNDIINDVLFSPDNPNQNHEHLVMSKYEEAESRRRITAILETMEGEDKARYPRWWVLVLGVFLHHPSPVPAPNYPQRAAHGKNRPIPAARGCEEWLQLLPMFQHRHTVDGSHESL